MAARAIATDKWTEQQLRPLVEFVYTLRAPQNADPPSGALVTVLQSTGV